MSECPEEIFFIIREPFRTRDTPGIQYRYRCHDGDYKGQKCSEASLVFENNLPISPNVTYLSAPKLIAATLQSRDGWNLRIMKRDGTIVREITGVNDQFSTNADGTQIVYLTGMTIGGSAVASTGTWILDVKSGESEKINPGGQDVYWSKKDNSIYISPEVTYDKGNRFNPESRTFDKTVLKYDPETKETISTLYGSCRFSSNETYYLSLGCEGMAFAVHETATNENITSRILGAYDTAGKMPVRWVSDKLLVLEDGIVIDCSASMVRCMECEFCDVPDILATEAKGTKLCVRISDNFVHSVPLTKIPTASTQSQSTTP
jgi:hypothetical protein